MRASVIFDSIVSTINQTSVTEWIIFILALFYVVLAALENIFCWLFGILSSALSVYLCYQGQLFLESGLQVFYVVIGAYGWYEWLRGSTKKAALPISSFSFSKSISSFFIGCLLWLPFGFIAHRYSTQALPYLDAFITAFSIVATWMTAKKIIQNWIFWIIIDALAVYLYASRTFYLIALLYGVYTVLSIIGYLQWKKKLTS